MDTTGTAALRCAIYTRISQDSTGQKAGVERQLEDCQALASRMGFTVVAHYDDNDLSAFSGKTRPDYEAMLTAMERGEFSAIVCWHPDRLYRSLKDLERLIDMTDRTDVQIRSVNGGDFDLSNATGKMVARILGSVSRQESEHKAERTRRANLQRRGKGAWAATGRVPFGYRKEGEKLNYTLEPNEPDASLIRQAAADVLAGVSLRSIAKDWTRRGLTGVMGGKINGTTITQILLNPTYAAYVTHGEEQRPRRSKIVGAGNWDPIIDRETYAGLVAFLTDPSRRKASAYVRVHMGSGVYRCGKCALDGVDSRMYSQQQMHDTRKTIDGKKTSVVGQVHTYRNSYVCSQANHLSRAGDPLDEIVSGVVLGILADTTIRDRWVPAPGVDLDELRTQRVALTARADELARMFAAGQIDGGQLGSGTAGLRTQLAAVDQLLAAAVATSPAMRLLDGDPDELVARWDAATPDTKGKIVAELMTVTVLPIPPGQSRKVFDPELIQITPRWE